MKCTNRKESWFKSRNFAPGLLFSIDGFCLLHSDRDHAVWRHVIAANRGSVGLFYSVSLVAVVRSKEGSQ
jgi:hypothetical protein